jgi:hypothetical protein
MKIDGIGGFGAQNLSMANPKDTFGAQVVGKTLEYMNQNQNQFGVGGMSNADYDFQTKVLSAGMLGKGGFADENV